MAAGFSLLELVITLAMAGLIVGAGVAGAAALADSLSVEAARRVVIDALLEARRRAYLQESLISVRTPVAASFVEIAPPPRHIDLPAGVAITKAPADAAVDFRASGLADNATVQLGRGSASATIVVNQRGMVR